MVTFVNGVESAHNRPTLLTNSFHHLKAFANVCGLCMVTLLNETPIFAWNMARLVVKNGHQEKMSIGLD